MNGIRTDVETSAWAEGGSYADSVGVLRWQRSVSVCTFDRSAPIGGQGGSKVVTSNLDALCLPRRLRTRWITPSATDNLAVVRRNGGLGDWTTGADSDVGFILMSLPGACCVR